MADRPTKESQETKESKEVKAPEGGGKKKLLSVPVLATVGAVLLICIGGAFVMMKPKHVAAEGAKGHSPEDWMHEAVQQYMWDFGEVKKQYTDAKTPDGRSIKAKVQLKVSKGFKAKLEKEVESILKAEVVDLIASILASRVPDVKLDVERANDLIAEDIMRGLKTGVNPNKPEAKTYNFPFNDTNLFKVYVGELQDSRW
jgi:hypothetical protein